MYIAEIKPQGLLVIEEMQHFLKRHGKATNLTIFAWSGTNWHTNRKQIQARLTTELAPEQEATS